MNSPEAKEKEVEQRRAKEGKMLPSSAKPCRLVIRPPMILNVSQDVMTRYLRECLGDSFVFSLEDTVIVDGTPSQFTFVFKSTNQGRRAEKLLRENASKTREEIDVRFLKDDPMVTTNTFLAKCESEIQGKIKAVTEQHGEKINEITGHLESLTVRKHIRLDEYEKVGEEDGKRIEV